MLSVVGIGGTPTETFLIRTEGVALIAAAGLLWAARGSNQARMRVILISLATYYLIGSAVDLMAFRDGIVGSLAVPSIAIRVVVGSLCLFAAARTDRADRGNQPSSVG